VQEIDERLSEYGFLVVCSHNERNKYTYRDNGSMVTMVTDVTIRAINDEVYNEFSAEARRQNRGIGEVTTDAMRMYLEKMHPPEREIQTVSYIDELRLSKRDLEEFGQLVVFRYIEHLVIEDDVDLETFERYISGIEYCERLEVPRHFPKLYAYSKCSHCEQVARRE